MNRFRPLLIGLAAAALAASLLLVGGASNDTTATSDTTATTIPDDTELIQLLTVDTVTADCLELTGSQATGVVPLKIGALEHAIPQGPRLWHDALHLPLKGDSNEAKMDDFDSSVCQDPILGNTWGHILAGMTIDGRKLVDLNPWLAKYIIDTDEISVRAGEFIPLLNVTNPSDEQIQNALTKNREWVSEAEWLISLIHRFSVYGEGSLESVLNYHLAGGGVVVGNLPVVEINPDQESEPSLILFISKKGACAPIKLIGINVGDRRPEEFAPPVCETTTTTIPCDCSTTSSVPSTTTPCDCSTTTTVVTSTTSVVTTTTVPHGKPGLPTTIAPPPLTAPAPTTSAPSGPTTSVGDSGVGAPTPATTVAPTPTVAPPATNPTPTTAPPGPGVTVTLP